MINPYILAICEQLEMMAAKEVVFNSRGTFEYDKLKDEFIKKYGKPEANTYGN